MTLRSHIAYFLRIHIFSLRILGCNLFNLVFWGMVTAGVNLGAKRGSAIIGLVLGTAAGVLFHALGYAAYVLTHRNEFIAEPGAAPNGGPATRSGNAEDSEWPPSVR
jgi:hypothetical protein